MKLYAISDTHFGHDKLVQLSGRPDDFTARLMRSISKEHGDMLIHCGDFCIGNDIVWIQAFMDVAKGFTRKILVRGNHDKKSDSWYLEHGFDFVCDSFRGEYFGKHVLFTHMPTKEGVNPWHTFFPVYKNIHGHLHGNANRHAAKEIYNPDYHYDLAPELHDYKPVNLESILAR